MRAAQLARATSRSPDAEVRIRRGGIAPPQGLMRPARSSSSTRLPAAPGRSAAVAPAGPPPTTTTSKVSKPNHGITPLAGPPTGRRGGCSARVTARRCARQPRRPQPPRSRTRWRTRRPGETSSPCASSLPMAARREGQRLRRPHRPMRVHASLASLRIMAPMAAIEKARALAAPSRNTVLPAANPGHEAGPPGRQPSADTTQPPTVQVCIGPAEPRAAAGCRPAPPAACRPARRRAAPRQRRSTRPA